MIIICDKCSKKFNVNDADIPENGRSLQCGNCGHKWFFKPNLNEKFSAENIDEVSKNKSNEIFTQEKNLSSEEISSEEIKIPEKTILEKTIIKQNIPKKVKSEKSEEKQKKNKSNFVGVFFVTIITFIALIIILDTFKNELSQIFPGIIPLLDNLYQTLYDVYLFFKDLIN